MSESSSSQKIDIATCRTLFATGTAVSCCVHPTIAPSQSLRLICLHVRLVCGGFGPRARGGPRTI